MIAPLAVAAGFLGATEGTASAQEWLKDRRYQEGQGIRVGDLELHPGIGGEIGYDSNWFLRTHKTAPAPNEFVNGPPNNESVGAGVLRLTPSFSVSTLSPQRLEGTDGSASGAPPVAFRAGLSATYREFIGEKQIRDQRNVSGNAFARVDINQQKPIGFGIFANYTRLIQPSVVADPNLSFNRSDVNGGAEIIVLPGGGTLDLRAGYQIFGALFEESQGVPFTNITHEISIRNRWKFRPRTALFHDTSLRFVNYPNANRALNYLNDSTPLRTRFGITGLLTERFGALAAVGYGATFFKNAGAASTFQYDSINAQLEGTFYLSQAPGSLEPGQVTLLMSTLTFGFVRDFQNSLLGNYYDSNKGYLRLVYNFGGRAIIQLDGFFEALGFPQPFYTTGGAPQAVNGLNGQPTGDFTNFRAGGIFFTEYRFTDVFGVNASVDYTQMISDTALAAGGGGNQFFDLNWRRIQAFAGARLFW
ncbi:MAG: hypothetical protein JST00_23430 [Deltaproteobacteria bacterium]|nr:hypothetical protein [Deltaproteobacteria bacterium]